MTMIPTERIVIFISVIISDKLSLECKTKQRVTLGSM